MTQTCAVAPAAPAAPAPQPPPAEVDACLTNPCTSGTAGPSVCTDLPYPAPNSAAGRTCSCAKTTSYFKDEATGCVDVDACVAWPCKQDGAGGAATCADIALAANSTAGRTCTCANGGMYADATGCPIVGKSAVLINIVGRPAVACQLSMRDPLSQFGALKPLKLIKCTTSCLQAASDVQQ